MLPIDIIKAINDFLSASDDIDEALYYDPFTADYKELNYDPAQSVILILSDEGDYEETSQGTPNKSMPIVEISVMTPMRVNAQTARDYYATRYESESISRTIVNVLCGDADHQGISGDGLIKLTAKKFSSEGAIINEVDCVRTVITFKIDQQDY